MIQLANILHSKGFTISIIHTKLNFPDTSKYPHFTFHQISDGLSAESDGSVSSDAVVFLKTLITTCQEAFRDCFSRLLADYTNRADIKCIITDAIWAFTQPVADRYSLPRIVLRTSSVGSYMAFAAFSILRKEDYLSEMQESEMEVAIEVLRHLKVKDIPLFKTQRPEDLYEIVDNMVEGTKKASALIFNTFKELEEQELTRFQNQFPKPVFAIGSFHKYFSASTSSLLPQDRSSISWLDTQAPRSVLDVSFCSIAAMDREKMHEVAWGLANSMQPFLWVVRPGLVHGSKWIEVLPKEFLEETRKRGHIVKWAPQQEVLSHPAVGGFWTDNGWNSTLESICEGVPMICLSFNGDQRVISPYVNDVWKIGIKFEKGLEREEIEDAIKKLMVGSEGEEMRQRIMCLKEKVALCLNLGGSSYQELDGLVNLISSFRSSA